MPDPLIRNEDSVPFRFASLALLSLFALSFIWAPLPLASNRWWSLALLAIWLWLLLLAAAGLVLLQGQSLARRLAHARWMLFFIGAFASLVGLQASGLLATSDVFQTRTYLLSSLTYFAAVALVALLATSPTQVQFLLLAIVCAGVVQAFIAVVLYSTNGTYEYFFVTFRQGGRATGTFPNPDHLAGFMELCLAAGLGLMVGLMRGGRRHSVQTWSTRAVFLLKFLLSPTMVLRMVLVVMVIALIMTHSRMGNGAFFLAMVMVGTWVAISSKRFRRTALFLMVSVIVIDLVLIGQWVGLDRVVERLQDTTVVNEVGMSGFGPGKQLREETIQERLRAPSRALLLVASRPWFGFGGGTFYAVFPPYKTPDMPYFYEHTHNDFIEVASDVGLIGLLLWVGAAAVALPQLRRRMRDNQPQLNAAVAVSAAIALCCMSLHSLVDFNLQITSNALLFVVLLALLWSPGLSSRAVESRAKLKTRQHRSSQHVVQPGSD